MKTHRIYVQTPDDMSGQDVVMAIAGAIEYATEDCAECAKHAMTDEDSECYNRKKATLENLSILEVEPAP